MREVVAEMPDGKEQIFQIEDDSLTAKQIQAEIESILS